MSNKTMMHNDLNNTPELNRLIRQDPQSIHACVYVNKWRKELQLINKATFDWADKLYFPQVRDASNATADIFSRKTRNFGAMDNNLNDQGFMVTIKNYATMIDGSVRELAMEFWRSAFNKNGAYYTDYVQVLSDSEIKNGIIKIEKRSEELIKRYIILLSELNEYINESKTENDLYSVFVKTNFPKRFQAILNSFDHNTQ